MNYNITGRKLQNFSQSELLEKLIPTYGAGNLEKQMAKDINAGICYMLSVEWLRRLFELPQAYPDSVFDSRFENAKILVYYKQIANNYCKYFEDFEYTCKFVSRYPSAETFERNAAKIDKKYVSYCFKDNTHITVSTTGPYTSSDDLNTVFYGSNALLIYLNVKPNSIAENGFAHEMAIWNYDSKHYFFDPNIGVYRLNDLSDIVSDIKQSYESMLRSGGRSDLFITEIIKS